MYVVIQLINIKCVYAHFDMDIVQHNVNYVAVRGNRRKLHIEEIEGESVL